MLHFRLRNILKFTQNSLVLISYLLNYSQQFFVSIMDENLRRGIPEDSDNHRVAKVSQRFIDGSFNEW